jgi:DeoR/GlpR family transcriptional regulator of sugar metabolism
MSGVEAFLRRRMIALRVQQQRGVRVGELLAELGCSYSTLSRDLDQMARDGLIRRVHGGVEPWSPIHIPPRSESYA